MAIPVNNSTKNISWLNKIFEDITLRSRDLKGNYGFGATDRINESMKTFPYLWMTPITTTVLTNSIGKYTHQEIIIQVIIADILRADEENMVETISDVNEIMDGIISELANHPYYKENKISLVNNILIDSEFDKSDAKVNRVVCRLTFRMPFKYTYCSAPIDIIPDYTSFGTIFLSVTQSFCELISNCIGDYYMGATGPQGPIGPTGPQGIQGEVGPTGPAGSTGPQGLIGPTGPQGIQGEVGPTGAGGTIAYSGNFYDTTTQTNIGATAVNLMRFNTTDFSFGVSIIDNTKIKIEQVGTYNIQFSAQVDKTDSGKDEIDIWLRKNGINIPNSNTIVEVDGNNAELVSAWNFLVQTNTNDYYELAWHSSDIDMRLLSRGTQSNPDRPAVPSVILSVSQVTYTQVGPTGSQGPQGIQGLIGPTGSQGPQGVQGPTGPQGIQGEVGPTGPSGATGPQGPIGPTGSSGGVQMIDIKYNAGSVTGTQSSPVIITELVIPPISDTNFLLEIESYLTKTSPTLTSSHRIHISSTSSVIGTLLATQQNSTSANNNKMERTLLCGTSSIFVFAPSISIAIDDVQNASGNSSLVVDFTRTQYVQVVLSANNNGETTTHRFTYVKKLAL